MYLRECDCVRLGVRSSEWVCEVDCGGADLLCLAGSLCLPGRDNHKTECGWVLIMWGCGF